MMREEGGRRKDEGCKSSWFLGWKRGTEGLSDLKNGRWRTVGGARAFSTTSNSLGNTGYFFSQWALAWDREPEIWILKAASPTRPEGDTARCVRI